MPLRQTRRPPTRAPHPRPLATSAVTPPSTFQVSKDRFLLPIILIIAGFLAYSNTFHVPFVFDDEPTIRDNLTIRQLWPLSVPLHPPGGGVTTHGRPLANLSFALNYALGGLNPVGYHIFNLIVHLLNGLLVFGLAKRALFPPRLVDPPPSRLTPHPSSAIAFAIALLWLLHPLCTQAVTYTVQRVESLATLFYLLTLYAFVRHAHEPCPARRSPWQRRAWAIASVTSCALGMACKETMVTAPLVALLLDRAFFAGQRTHEQVYSTPSPSVGAPLAETYSAQQVRASAAPTAPTAPVGAPLAETYSLPPLPSPSTGPRERGLLHLLLWSTLFVQLYAQTLSIGDRGANTGLGAGVTVWHYLLTQAQVIPHYLRLAFWPRGLTFDYNWPIVTHLPDALPGLILTGALVLLALVLWFTRPRLGFPLLAFFLILAPTSSFMPIADPAFEQRMYLPLVMLVALVVWGAEKLIARRWTLGRSESPSIAGSSAPTLPPPAPSAPIREIRGPSPSPQVSSFPPRADQPVAGQFPVSIRPPSPPRFADTPIRRHLPAALAATLALTLAFATHRRNAVYHSAFSIWDDAVRQRPQNPRAIYNRGVLHQEAGRLDDALADFVRAIAIAPQNPGPYYNRANVYVDQERLDEAIADYTRAIEGAPSNLMPRANRARAYAALGRHADAIQDYTIAMIYHPDRPRLPLERARSHAALGHTAEALADFTRALKLDPASADALTGRALAFFQLGQPAAARADVARLRAAGAPLDQNLINLISEE